MKQGAGFSDFRQAFSWLVSRTNYETMATQRYDERTYGLDRVRRLLDAAGAPHRAMTCVQVVGSKGKGSTATALASILATAGEPTGLFTSPHLVHPLERIQVGGAPVPERVFRDALTAVRGSLADCESRTGERFTFFEILTVTALECFRALGCTSAVLEAGMGGRLDATTAVDAQVAVLTGVSLDHVRHLGRTRVAVVREKAAVMREATTLVSGVPPRTAEGREVDRTAEGIGARVLAVRRDFRVRRVRTSFDAGSGRSRTAFRLEFGEDPPLDLELPLLGTHQALNGALAVVAQRVLRGAGGRTTDVAAGLRDLRLPARLQPVSRRPWTFLDGAHSPASMGALARTVRDRLGGSAVFVVGMAEDKDVRGSLRALRGVASRVVAVSSGQPRAMEPAALARIAHETGLEASAAPSLAEALRLGRDLAGPDGCVVVTGSLYLCGAYLADYGDLSSV